MFELQCVDENVVGSGRESFDRFDHCDLRCFENVDAVDLTGLNNTNRKSDSRLAKFSGDLVPLF